MGMYDTVGEQGIQIKCTEQDGSHYTLHSKIRLNDGLYIGYEGYFIVKNQTIIFTGDEPFFTKWGHEIDKHELLDLYNPVSIAVKQLIRKEDI